MYTRRPLLLLLLLPALAVAQESYTEKIESARIAFKMVQIPAGSFRMGSTSPMADPDESPVREVRVDAFWMEDHEVTFEEWDAYFKDISVPQSKNIDGLTRATPQYIDLTWGMGRRADHPTNSMSHQAAMMYCKWLWTRTGKFYRLPTEAEWEYACLAGGKKEFPVSDLQNMAWFKDNSGGQYHPVKGKSANAWGLYDMLGNLSEWTLDQYDPQAYGSLTTTNPLMDPASRYPKSVRGGSYLDGAAALRCSNRIASEARWNQRDPQIPKSRWWLTDGMFMGFRVVRPVQQPSGADIAAFYDHYLR